MAHFLSRPTCLTPYILHTFSVDSFFDDRRKEERATFDLLSQRLIWAIVLTALTLGGCTSRDSDEIPIPPPRTTGASLPTLPPGMGGSLPYDGQTPPAQTSAPPNYFGPNAVGTGTTSGPSPNIPFVDSVSSCAAILDSDARQLCLQRAGQR